MDEDNFTIKVPASTCQHLDKLAAEKGFSRGEAVVFVVEHFIASCHERGAEEEGELLLPWRRGDTECKEPIESTHRPAEEELFLGIVSSHGDYCIPPSMVLVRKDTAWVSVLPSDRFDEVLVGAPTAEAIKLFPFEEFGLRRGAITECTTSDYNSLNFLCRLSQM